MSKTISLNREKLIPFGLLISILRPNLDEDQATQIKALYIKLRKKEIPRHDFLRSLRSIAGADTVKMAVYQIVSRDAPNQIQEENMLLNERHGFRVGQKRPLNEIVPDHDRNLPIKEQKVSISGVISTLLPQLDDDRVMQVKASFIKFAKKEISKGDIIQSLCSIAGGDVIKSVVQDLFSGRKRDAGSMKDLIDAFERDFPASKSFGKSPTDAAVIVTD